MSLDQFINILATLFVTIDPIGMIPIFLALTTGASFAERSKIAITACTIAAVVLAIFIVAGNELLAALGISLPAFRIAGGMLLFMIAYEMVFEKRTQRKAATAEKASDSGHNIAVFPLAVPLIAGPGSISALLLLTGQHTDVVGKLELAAATAIILLVTLAAFMASGPIDRILGATGRLVVTRLLGILLAALSVQFVADGILVLARS